MSTYFKSLLQRQLGRINFDGAIWAVPIVVGAGWVLWPAMDYEWKMSMGLAIDPEASVNYVQQLKDQRLAAHLAVTGKKIKSAKDDEEDEEEEETADEEEEDVVAEGGGDDDEEGGDHDEEGGDDDEEGGDDEEEEDEDDGEPKKLDIPSLYDPVKGENVAVADLWDNFTLKALNMSDDDDDEEEE